MAFTYNSPPDNPKDEVRFWSTDTTQQPYSVSDEDIAYLLALPRVDGNVMEAAAMVADRIADYWASESSASGSDVSIGPFSLGAERSGAELEKSWRDLAKRLRTGTTDGSPVIADVGLFTGGRRPEFSVGMQDNGYQRFPVRDRDNPRPANGVW